MVTVESSSALRRTSQLARDLWEISRPGIFFVSLVPFYLGYLLAGREFLGPNILGLLVGFVVWGPLVWLAVLAINDAYDYEGDLLNPRKNTPLTTGRLSVRGAIVAAYGAVAISLAISYAFRPSAVLATLGFVVCGWIYSVPPLKWKNRPGLDVLSNCTALGVFPVLVRAPSWATGGNERLALVAGDRPFVVINPLYVLHAPADGSAPCLIDRFYAPIFRIAGRDPTELFCAAGLAVPGDSSSTCTTNTGFAA
jgi:hypothetical protein